MKSFIDDIKEKFDTDILKDFSFNVDMSDYVSFKASGEAMVLYTPSSVSDIVTVLEFLKSENIPFVFIGKGSNLLFKSSGYKGVVIKIGNKISKVDFIPIEDDKYEVLCLAGASMLKVGIEAMDLSLTGFEPIMLVPGTVGGAIYMNAGAYGTEIKDIVKSITVLDVETLEVLEYNREQCNFSYRHSTFMEKDLVILGATFELSLGNKEEISNTYKSYKEKRSNAQPLDKASAGSTFKRPKGDYAGRLIEASGLKGVSVGGAMVSEKHAGFIVNYENATVDDIIGLIEKVKETVFEKENVMLEEEVQIIG